MIHNDRPIERVVDSIRRFETRELGGGRHDVETGPRGPSRPGLFRNFEKPNALGRVFQLGCKLLHVLVQYFMVATYFWMFCEGLYLHTLLVVTFLTESKVMPFLHTIGWGIPALLVSTYAALRTATTGETLQLVRFTVAVAPWSRRRVRVARRRFGFVIIIFKKKIDFLLIFFF